MEMRWKNAQISNSFKQWHKACEFVVESGRRCDWSRPPGTRSAQCAAALSGTDGFQDDAFLWRRCQGCCTRDGWIGAAGGFVLEMISASFGVLLYAACLKKKTV